MRIYAVADIHSRSDRMDAIRKNAALHQPDVLVAAGDITSYRNHRFVSELDTLSLPVLMVRGNTDSKNIETRLGLKGNIVHLNNVSFVIQGTHFVGVTGTIPIPFRSRIAFRESAIWRRLIPEITRRTILVAHPPPWGYVDRVHGKYHAGCKSLERVIRRYQPAVTICGHIHEDAGTACLGRTLIVNCAMSHTREGCIIDIAQEKITVEVLGR